MKNKKLFPDFSDQAAISERGYETASSPGARDRDFDMTDGVWESLLREPAFEAQLRTWIDRIASERVGAKVAQIESETRAKAQAEGFESGLASAKKTIEDALAVLHDVTAQLAREKSDLLTAHEKTFCESFASVLEKIAVPDSDKWLAQVEGMIQKYKAEFSDKGRVEVSVSPDTLKILENVGIKAVDGLRWSIRANDELKPGDIQIDFGGVGLQLLPDGLVEEWKAVLAGQFKKTG